MTAMEQPGDGLHMDDDGRLRLDDADSTRLRRRRSHDTLEGLMRRTVPGDLSRDPPEYTTSRSTSMARAPTVSTTASRSPSRSLSLSPATLLATLPPSSPPFLVDLDPEFSVPPLPAGGPLHDTASISSSSHDMDSDGQPRLPLVSFDDIPSRARESRKKKKKKMPTGTAGGRDKGRSTAETQGRTGLQAYFPPIQAPDTARTQTAPASGAAARQSSHKAPADAAPPPSAAAEVQSDPEPAVLLDAAEADRAALRHRLEAQLARLKAETQELEQALVDAADGLAFQSARLDHLGPLLMSKDPACDGAAPCPVQPSLSSRLSALLPFASMRPLPASTDVREGVNDDDDSDAETVLSDVSEPFLKLFAPLELSIGKTSFTVETAPAKPAQYESPLRISQRYSLRLFESSPDKTGVFSVALQVSVDAIRQRVTSVEVLDTTQALPGCLQDWVSARLCHDLFRRDVSGLCWGICRYWEAVRSRAELWRRLAQWQDGHTRGKAVNGPANRLTHSQSCSDFHYSSSQNCYTISIGRLAHEHRHSHLQLIVSCPINLDLWTGEAELVPAICAWKDGRPSRTVDHACQHMFRDLLSEQVHGRGEHETRLIPTAIFKAVQVVASTLQQAS